jgi:hypothetical protein
VLCWLQIAFATLALQCGFPVTPRLQLVLPDGVDIISIVWRDKLNRTVALDITQVHLPALAPLLEASVANTEQCNSGCDWSYHVSIHVMLETVPQQRLFFAVTTETVTAHVVGYVVSEAITIALRPSQV